MLQAWYKLLCRPIFFQNTLELSPPSDVIFSSVSSNPTFHHGLCFFASVAAFLFMITHPYLGEYCASTSDILSGALAALSLSLLPSLSDDVDGGSSGSLSRGRVTLSSAVTVGGCSGWL
jgi:hypothetical protein